MEKELLRKVQLAQLEIANEIKRVCEENNIQYFLTAVTLPGSARKNLFMRWKCPESALMRETLKVIKESRKIIKELSKAFVIISPKAKRTELKEG